MTDEMKANDASRYVVVNNASNAVEGLYAAEGEAKTNAETLAADNDGIEFSVYTKIGSAKLQPKVIWKGAAR